MNRAQRLGASLLSALAAEAAVFLCFAFSGDVKWLPLLAFITKFIVGGWILSLTFVLPLSGANGRELLLIAVAGIACGPLVLVFVDLFGWVNHVPPDWYPNVAIFIFGTAIAAVATVLYISALKIGSRHWVQNRT